MGERIYRHPQIDCFIVSQLFSVVQGENGNKSNSIKMYIDEKQSSGDDFIIELFANVIGFDF